jgi:hypothetical protein
MVLKMRAVILIACEAARSPVVPVLTAPAVVNPQTRPRTGENIALAGALL